MNTIIITLIVSFSLAFILGILLGFFKKVFSVPVDSRIQEIRNVLSGGNCGACGYPGCDAFAKAVAEGKAPITGCAAGGETVAKLLGNIMGVNASATKKLSILACQGSKEHTQLRGIYNGVKTCKAAKISINGTKMCQFGCIGFGDCVQVCSFDALFMGDDGLPHVDLKKCTGCGMCANICPQNLFKLVGENTKGSIPLCSNTSNSKTILKQCKKGCIKCGKCVRSCKYEAISLVNNIPVIDYEKCTSCGDCVKECPTKVLTLIEDIFNKN